MMSYYNVVPVRVPHDSMLLELGMGMVMVMGLNVTLFLDAEPYVFQTLAFAEEHVLMPSRMAKFDVVMVPTFHFSHPQSPMNG